MSPIDTAGASWHPVAYVSVADERCRARIGDALQQLGWLVVEYPSAFHLLGELADLIEGRLDRPRPRPCLIVVDEVSRGVAGTTLAHGLRELDLVVPVVLVGEARPASAPGPAVYAVDRERAATAIEALVAPWSPTALLPPQPRSIHASA